MTPCVGWPADPPCGVYGLMHGCKLPDGHAGRVHVCECGARVRSNTRRRIKGASGMSTCPTCGLPLVWSIDRERVICCVYGDHPTPTPANVVTLPPTPGALMLAADDELYGDNVHPLYARGKVGA